MKNNPRKEIGLNHNLVMLSDIIDADPSNYEEVSKNKGKESTSSRRMMHRMQYQRPEGKSIVSSVWIYTCSRWKHHGIQGNICSMRLLIERRYRLRREICIQQELRHMTDRIMCANEISPCTSSKDTHGITHT